ncbi:NADP-dependent oxidoreductase [Kitasatospora sp. LaBMicrA B282]|uniref:NADP-dependent oxidoreductase n=1 Tax=Kitasatospora sp. LaBMicrA B282 TaxID=3420949 RepID=UPI003D0B6D8A
MRAVVVRSYGGPEVLELAEVALPEPGPGELRVRVRAAVVNPVDEETRKGGLAALGLHRDLPELGLGWDAAGEVDAVGEGVGGYRVGDRVIGMSAGLEQASKAYAEYVVLGVDAVAPAPDGVAPEQAATVPLNGLTAWQGLDLLDLPAGAAVLISGAAGGVGAFAVELAAARGLRVVAQAGAADEQLVRGLGAEFFVPRGADIAAAVRAVLPDGVDGVLDTAVLGAALLAAVRDGGALVAVRGGAAPEPERGIRSENVWVRPDTAQLAELAARAGTGRLTLRVADTYPLDQAAAAHHRLAEGGVRGRLVLLP